MFLFLLQDGIVNVGTETETEGEARWPLGHTRTSHTLTYDTFYNARTRYGTPYTHHIHVYHRTYAARDGAVRPVSSRQPAPIRNCSPGDNPETIRKSSDFLRDITRSARGWDFGLKPKQRHAAPIRIADQERKKSQRKKRGNAV